MKKIINNTGDFQFRLLQTFLIVITMGLSASLVSCSGDDDVPADPQDPQAAALQKLISGTWSVNSVTRDGIDVTDDFSGFTLNFTSSGFTATNGDTAWEGSGTWSWADAQGNSIQLSNGILVQLSFSNDDTRLTLSFTVPTTTFDIGRSQGIAGNYVFILGK